MALSNGRRDLCSSDFAYPLLLPSPASLRSLASIFRAFFSPPPKGTGLVCSAAARITAIGLRGFVSDEIKRATSTHLSAPRFAKQHPDSSLEVIVGNVPYSACAPLGPKRCRSNGRSDLRKTSFDLLDGCDRAEEQIDIGAVHRSLRIAGPEPP